MMRRIFGLTAALVLLLTACGTDMLAVSEVPTAATQTTAPVTAVPSETPEPENTASAELPTAEGTGPVESPMPGAPDLAGTASPESAAPAQTPKLTESIKEQENNTMTITINGQVFHATLYDNETAAALKGKLPLTLDMSELNSNEKYNYLSFSLPTNAGNPGQIHAGDLMLYGSNCLVLFYESFSTSYRYTPIGRINDPSGLAEAVGRSDVQVTFTLG